MWEEKGKKEVKKKEKRRKKETDCSRSVLIFGGGRPDAWAAEGEVRGRW